MSTRSGIAIKHKDGTVDATYCHYDGYLEGVGDNLKKYFRSAKKVNDLIHRGDIRSIDGPDAEYFEDAVGFDDEKRYSSLSDFLSSDLGTQDFTYVFDEGTNRWYFTSSWGDIEDDYPVEYDETMGMYILEKDHAISKLISKKLSESHHINLKENDSDLNSKRIDYFANLYYKHQDDTDHEWSKKDVEDWISDEIKDGNDLFDLNDDCVNLLLDFQHDLYKQDSDEDLNENSEEVEDNISFEDKVADAYDNCNYSLRADMPTIKDILDYLDLSDTSENRKKVSDIVYKLGKDWQVEESCDFMNDYFDFQNGNY